MKLVFDYKESMPDINSYHELLHKMSLLSNKLSNTDKVFTKDFDYNLIKQYENKKIKIVGEMFKTIINYFPVLKEIPCAIYLSGSFARGNITAGSDLDLTFYFKKEEVSKYQSLIYLIRYAISVVFNVNMVHVHSFTKNFTTIYRKEHNMVITDEHLETIIKWQSDGDIFNITYPDNQMIPEREICEIESIKDIISLEKLFKNQIDKLIPEEWIYTHKCVHITDDYFSIENLIKRLDNCYDEKDYLVALNNVSNKIKGLINEISEYYNNLKASDLIELSKFNMIGKRKVSMLVHSFAVYLRLFYNYKGLNNVPLTLNLNSIFNYNNGFVDMDLIHYIDYSYTYFRYLISRIEIWTKKYKHHYEHRSNEIVDVKILNNEYMELWKNDYYPIEEQAKSFEHIKDGIIKALIR